MTRQNTNNIGASKNAESYVLKRILNGTWEHGFRLESERKLSKVIGVNRCTLRTVLNSLSREGWVSLAHGKNTVVNDLHTMLTLKPAIRNLDLQPEVDRKKFIKGIIDFEFELFSILIRKQKNNSLTQQSQFLIVDAVDKPDVERYSRLLKELCMVSEFQVYALLLNEIIPLYAFYLRFYTVEENTQELRQLIDCVQSNGNLERISVLKENIHNALIRLIERT